MSILPLVALVILATACERHPASELGEEHGAGGHPGAESATAEGGQPSGAPMHPASESHQPGGAQPVAAMDEHSKAEKSSAAEASAPPAEAKTSATPHSTEPAPSFFGGGTK